MSIYGYTRIPAWMYESNNNVDELLEKYRAKINKAEEKPKHYKRNDVEVKDVLKLIFKYFDDDLTSMEASCIFNIVKYLMRCKYKDDPVGDIEKAETYLSWFKEDIKKELNNE